MSMIMIDLFSLHVHVNISNIVQVKVDRHICAYVQENIYIEVREKRGKGL
jgi:hypothetical protein